MCQEDVLDPSQLVKDLRSIEQRSDVIGQCDSLGHLAFSLHQALLRDGHYLSLKRLHNQQMTEIGSYDFRRAR